MVVDHMEPREIFQVQIREGPTPSRTSNPSSQKTTRIGACTGPKTSNVNDCFLLFVVAPPISPKEGTVRRRSSTAELGVSS